MMFLTAAVVIAWIAAGYRLWVSWSQPHTVWRTAFTVAMTCNAITFTVYRWRSDLDEMSGISNLAGLVARIVIVFGTASLLIYLDTLRREQIVRATIAAHVASAAGVSLILVASWTRAPIHRREMEDLLAPPLSLAITIYCVTFWLYMALGLIVMARTCLRRGRSFRERDIARSVGLTVIGIAGLAGLPVLVLWSISLVVTYAGREGQGLNHWGDAIMPISVSLIALGVISLVVVPYALTMITVRHRARRLSRLWRALVTFCPEVHLPFKPSGGPLTRGQLQLERMIIEIRDALRIVSVDPATVNGTPVRAVAISLSQPGRRVGPRAADVLEQPLSREADVEQLLELADEYESQQRVAS